MCLAACGVYEAILSAAHPKPLLRNMARAQFLLGGAVGGVLGGFMLKAHSMTYLGIAFQLRAMAAGRQTFEEYSHESPLAALKDARAWNRLVLDVHAKVLQWWPQPSQ